MPNTPTFAMEPDRISFWGTERLKGNGSVLYWMQASPRLTDNFALSWAADQARRENRPLAVLTVIDPQEQNPGLAQQFYEQGLALTAQQLQAQGLTLVVLRGDPRLILPKAAQNAAFVVLDRSYTLEQRQLHREVARLCPVPLVGVEDNVTIPVKSASSKEEWSAATFRPKLWKALHQRSPEHAVVGDVADGGPELASQLNDSGFTPIEVSTGGALKGGELAAQEKWQDFLAQKLSRYGQRNDPLQEVQSGLSAYLRFGFISPLTLLRDLQTEGLWKPQAGFAPAGTDPRAEFLDEVFVRRELSVNFVFYQPLYRQFEGLPSWAQATLNAHRNDPREVLYQEKAWDEAQTHDEVWNACQNLLKTTGQMPGYLRMY
ncbi:MAG: hypothetical protein HKM05_12410, partial [Spirochaetales bacterium]|nr:hypothetical protein [Spirochaetales bacterium]